MEIVVVLNAIYRLYLAAECLVIWSMFLWMCKLRDFLCRESISIYDQGQNYQMWVEFVVILPNFQAIKITQVFEVSVILEWMGFHS